MYSLSEVATRSPCVSFSWRAIMRKFWISAAIAVACGFSGRALQGAEPTCGCEAPACAAVAASGDACCDPCNGRRQRGPRYEGLDPFFNCGCNGSYKFPVPPLYTYHWPGMYSAQLMTDYHSPWRFPPLKPYSDEVPAVEMGAVELSPRELQPVSASGNVAARPVGEMESMSSRMLRMR
jgi:hypothetical protein